MKSIVKKISFFRRKYKQFGFRAIMFLLTSRFKRNRTSNIKVANVTYPISLSNFNIDVTTLFKVFFCNEYDVHLKTAPSYIIDCGANIGLSTVFFACKFPYARIIAVEPDRNNFDYLIMNTARYHNVTCINKAIWSNSCRLKLIDPGVGSWGYQTVEASEDEEKTIEAITLDSILCNYNIDKIDLLKIDIEGAEVELFSRNYNNWLSRTNLLAIELHENLNNDIKTSFFKTIESYPCKQYYLGENLICDFNI